MQDLSIQQVYLMTQNLKGKSKSCFRGLQALESAKHAQPQVSLSILSVRNSKIICLLISLALTRFLSQPETKIVFQEPVLTSSITTNQ